MDTMNNLTKSTAPIHSCCGIPQLRSPGACLACLASPRPASGRAVAGAILTLAVRHAYNGAAMATSAQSCLRDALASERHGELGVAAASALRSLRYSVGILHGDYAFAASLVGAAS